MYAELSTEWFQPGIEELNSMPISRGVYPKDRGLRIIDKLGGGGFLS